jgi:hypothetical protein
LNGKALDVAFTSVPELELYPVVGLDSNDIVTFNFGKQPFLYDFSEEPRPVVCPPPWAHYEIASDLEYESSDMEEDSESEEEEFADDSDLDFELEANEEAGEMQDDGQ